MSGHRHHYHTDNCDENSSIDPCLPICPSVGVVVDDVADGDFEPIFMRAIGDARLWEFPDCAALLVVGLSLGFVSIVLFWLKVCSFYSLFLGSV